MYYNPSYMNPIMKGLNVGQPQQTMQPPQQTMQPPQQQTSQQYDFSGWGDRLGKIEEGIASLTNQFNNFQTPGDVAPEYTGSPAPNPLDPPKIDPKWGGGLKAMPLPDLTGPPGGLTKIGGPGITGPNFSPYQRNEDLDLTNRSNIMQEYGNYLQGGHGTQGPMPAMSRIGQFMGEEQSVNYANDFGTFLDTFGIRDRLQFPEQQLIKAGPQQTGITSLAQNNQGPGI